MVAVVLEITQKTFSAFFGFPAGNRTPDLRLLGLRTHQLD